MAALAISKSEKSWIEAGTSNGVREDGRGPGEARRLWVESGVVSQANGSARVKLGKSHAVVGVKLEVGQPKADEPGLAVVAVSVDCCPSASPEFEGRGAAELNAELSRWLEGLLTTPGALPREELALVPGRHVWIVSVDALVLDSDGNLFDAVTLGAKAALDNTTVPQLRILTAEDGSGDVEFELEQDGSQSSAFNGSGVPLSVSWVQVGNHWCVDPSIREELCMSSRVSFAIQESSSAVLRVDSGGAGWFNGSDVKNLVERSSSVLSKWAEVLKEAAEVEEERRSRTAGTIEVAGLLSG